VRAERPEIHQYEKIMKALREAPRSEICDFLKRQPWSTARFLYKYVAPDSLSVRSLIVDSKIWLASPSSFNDPFEMATAIIFDGTPGQKMDALKLMAKNAGINGLERRKRAQIAYQENKIQEISNIHKAHVNQFGVACFSRDGAKNLLMWSHYADSHKGFCFVFHVPSSISELIRCLPVTYSDDYQTINWLKRTDLQGKLGKSLYRKSTAWRYEKEYRLVEYQAAATSYSINPRAVIAVGLGAKASSKEEADLIGLLRERRDKGLPTVKVFRSVLANRQYRLELKRASDIERDIK
jgi:hypothetical protein